jgi:hypothetical protein
LIGVYFPNKDVIYAKRLAQARKVIANFPLLNKLFNNFQQYKNDPHTRNAVLSLCRQHARSTGAVKHMLTELEKAIGLFDVFNWNTAEFNELESRITNSDRIPSYSVCLELLVAKRLVDTVGNSKVELFPKIESGFSDILVELKDKVVYVEVGVLGESLPERKIQKILDETAEHLGTKLLDRCYFSATIDTAELAFSHEGYIDEKASITKATEEIDRLHLESLKGFEGTMRLDEIGWVIARKELLQKMDSPLIDQRTRENLERIRMPIVKGWIDLCRNEIVRGSNFFKGGFICKKLKHLLVEIRTLGEFPSKSATKELDSFLNHFERHVNTQLTQLQPKNANIIAVGGYNWILFGLGFEPLYTRIKQFFQERQESCLSGIVVLKDRDKSVYVNNDSSTGSSRLTKEDVERLNFRWFEPPQ